MIEAVRQLAAEGAASVPARGSCEPSNEGSAGRTDDPCLTRLRLLLTTVESQIIPRLVLAHRMPAANADAAAAPATRAGNDEVEICLRLALGSGVDALTEFAERLVGRGVPIDSVYVDVFAAVARRLGEQWTLDQCSFTDVTIALGRLQQVLRRLSVHFRPVGAPAAAASVRRALFGAAPGEQHTFGLTMIVQCFLRAGWDAALLPSPADEDMAAQVRGEHVALVGLTLSSELRVEALKRQIARLRATSRNPNLCILVGGHAFASRSGLESEVGADGTSTDGNHAVELARQLVSSPPRSSG